MKGQGLNRICVAGLLMAGVTAALSILGDRQVVINTSLSVAPGLYVRSSEAPAVGKLIDFRIPSLAHQYVYNRTGNSGESWYILKPVVAGPGDRVDTTGEALFINGHRIAAMPPPKDRHGIPLPVWRQDRVLGPDEFFVFSDRIPNSFDSRCYGPIRKSHIQAVRVALLTW